MLSAIRRFGCSAILALLLTVGNPISASAVGHEIVILDTKGIPRATETVHDHGDVAFDLVDRSGIPADGIEVTLTDKSTGQVTKAFSTNGTVNFQNLKAGNYTVATSARDITFTNVSIATNDTAMLGGASLGAAGSSIGAGLSGVGASVASAAPAVAVVGGVGVAGVAASKRISDDNDDGPPTVRVPTPRPLSESR